MQRVTMSGCSCKEGREAKSSKLPAACEPCRESLSPTPSLPPYPETIIQMAQAIHNAKSIKAAIKDAFIHSLLLTVPSLVQGMQQRIVSQSWADDNAEPRLLVSFGLGALLLSCVTIPGCNSWLCKAWSFATAACTV